ncbi:MAG: helix-turn-helix transcriptional regulator [Phascolarctobacterium sp.]|nr:helix-turn-helix transcriptional regulator [Phascolarctobacterium sp.]
MNEAIFKDIGMNIVFHRKLRGITQVILAKRVNIGIAKLSKIERGLDVENVPLSIYLKIAESLNISVIELIKSTDVRVKTICINKKLAK